ncbi:hypothetical protein [Methylobacterium sp. 391_Methyba4]|uniref:hypothetical protein n=1 Tax=Methylobacterium sp. 391_Methyba4 TaxID=3038924 RepID=UPI00241F6424|nr:hypothetical protein [Methylobacterium sp. 391_Methyba4]WFS07624.1 hypothetical protein P9K36_30465 [Methylobacterium sp. 391_Methyba4]
MARERCREEARASALSQVAGIPLDKLSDESRELFADNLAKSWLANFDASLDRVGAVLRSPEALGRERLARILLAQTKFSAEVIVGLLGTIGDDVFVLSLARVA